MVGEVSDFTKVMLHSRRHWITALPWREALQDEVRHHTTVGL